MKTPLPIRDGVGPSTTWLPEGSWKTLLEYLLFKFPDVDEGVWVSRMQRKQVVDEKGFQFSEDSPYLSGVRIYYYRELDNEIEVPFQEKILYQDPQLLVVDKPHFLAVVPSGEYLHQTLLVRLRKKLQLDHLSPLHRIDRETAGVVLFSVDSATRGDYQSLFARREVNKLYHALAPLNDKLDLPLTYKSRLVEGEPFFRMQQVEGDANSETHIELIEKRGDIGLYQLKPVTGKKHQLRVQLSELGIPIINDPFYPCLQNWKDKNFSNPLKLLAKSISFVDPLSGKERYFESLLSLY